MKTKFELSCGNSAIEVLTALRTLRRLNAYCYDADVFRNLCDDDDKFDGRDRIILKCETFDQVDIDAKI